MSITSFGKGRDDFETQKVATSTPSSSAAAGGLTAFIDQGSEFTGKLSFKDEDLKANFEALTQAVVKAKPSGAKGKYVKKVSLTSSMGPGLKIDIADHVDRKLRRFMGDGAAYNYIAMQEAIADAGLESDEVSHERSGLVMGSGGPSTQNQVLAADRKSVV